MVVEFAEICWECERHREKEEKFICACQGSYCVVHTFHEGCSAHGIWQSKNLYGYFIQYTIK